MPLNPRTQTGAAPAHLYSNARRSGAFGAAAVDLDALRNDLEHAIGGEVRFDAGTRALYATDASNYRQVPLGVVVPRDARDVERALGVARRHRAPVFARGGGTSLAGQCCNTGIVFDFSKTMNRLVAVDPSAATARVEAGIVLDALRRATEPRGLTFGPDPATHAWCTLGGMIGNNSCGVHSVMSELYGPGPTTADQVEELDVVTYRGVRMRLGRTDDALVQRTLAAGGPEADLMRRLIEFRDRYADLIRRDFPRIPRRVSGYNLPALLPENGFHLARAIVGSESTLALVLEASVRLIPSMPHRVLVIVGFEDVFAAADQVDEVLEHRPVGLEGFDDKLVEDLKQSGLGGRSLELLPQGGGWLLVEFGADSAGEALARARRFSDGAKRMPRVVSVSLLDAPDEQHAIWVIRESGLAATARVASDRPTWPGWEDSAVPPARFGAYLREMDALFKKHGYHADLYGHFGQGCLHCRIDFDLRSKAGVETFRRFMEEAADLVHRYGGSLSGEHGDGQARGELLGRMFSRDMLQAFREFKSIWDPDWLMNPGKVIDANPLDADLRIGPSYAPRQERTWFHYPEDGGSFATATRRCVGVGKCRKGDAGTMCPSYMVTGEEQHSTRGRARLLFEMLQGDPLQGGWDSDAVHEALDLCLACKGCKGECPVHVDVATYKAEFLAHYYERRWRPRSAYAFGLVRTWARLASRAPRVVNTLSHAPVLGAMAKLVAGIAPARRIPSFAPETFRSWFARRPHPAAASGRRLILWPDTFNDHFFPETLKSAVDVLEGLGYDVHIPTQPLCCGRPLYDFGLLDAACRRLDEMIAGLEPEISASTPIVVLEPSCLSVFRDELVSLSTDATRARRLKDQTLTLAGLLARDGRLPAAAPAVEALVHVHCHQKALLGTDAERSILERLGVRVDLPDTGCCGMAGAFGFERSHFDVSQGVGERRLLPAVRAADPNTVIVADGFSCREQIAQNTNRRPMHFAQLVQMVMRGSEPGTLPERRHVADHSKATLTWRELAGAALVATAAALVLVRSARRPSAGTVPLQPEQGT